MHQAAAQNKHSNEEKTSYKINRRTAFSV